MIKKILFVLFFVFGTMLSVFAEMLDTSIDNEIRKKYDVAPVMDLPALPKTEPSNTNISHPEAKITTPTPIQKLWLGESVTIKGGAKFDAVLSNKVSCYSTKGTAVSFTSTSSVYHKGILFPSYTKFVGVITDSHPPQISGNGGLISLKVTQIQYKGHFYPINTKICVANGKRIFFNDIKGKRLYMKNFVKASNPGKKFFKKSLRGAKRLSGSTIGLVLTPVPILCGGVVYLTNVVVAPVAAIFLKGGQISLPAGTHFQIKIVDDFQVRK